MKSALQPHRSVLALQADPHSGRLDWSGFCLASPFSGPALAPAAFPTALQPQREVPPGLWATAWWLASLRLHPLPPPVATLRPMLSPVGCS